MSERTSYFALVIVLMILGLYFQPWRSDQTNIKLFCTNGKLFIQFEEKHNTWGTMWLDSQGKPINCNDGAIFEEKISTTTTI